jgi:hypothetical protein
VTLAQSETHPKKKKRRFSLFGDFNHTDMEDPHLAKKFFAVANADMVKSKKIIKNLHLINRRSRETSREEITDQEVIFCLVSV